MGAYLVPLGKPRCFCGRPATVEIFNRYNASAGKFCRSHGTAKLREFEQRARAEQSKGAG